MYVVVVDLQQQQPAEQNRTQKILLPKKENKLDFAIFETGWKSKSVGPD